MIAIRAWINNYIYVKQWDVIINPSQLQHRCSLTGVEVGASPDSTLYFMLSSHGTAFRATITVLPEPARHRWIPLKTSQQWAGTKSFDFLFGVGINKF